MDELIVFGPEISLCGFIAIFQVHFRLVEMYSHPESDHIFIRTMRIAILGI